MKTTKPTTAKQAKTTKKSTFTFEKREHPVDSMKSIVASGLKNGVMTDYQVFNLIEMIKVAIDKGAIDATIAQYVASGANVLLGLANKYSLVKLEVLNKTFIEALSKL